jgi:hexokinase
MPEFKSLQGDACFRVPKRKKTSVVLIQSFKPTTVNDTRRQIEDYCRDLIINNDHISQMEQRLRAAIDKGLDKKSHQFASVKCFPTYVRDLPSGTEFGKFLALDLGGTNFRVVLMDIGPNAK